MTSASIPEGLEIRTKVALAPDHGRPSSRFLTKLFPLSSLSDPEQLRLAQVVGPRLKVPRGQNILLAGAPCIRLYAIHIGSFKSYQLTVSGGLQIFDFHFPGQILGLDALGLDVHHCGAMALEDSEVFAIPAVGLQELLADFPDLRNHFHFLMRQEVCHTRKTILMLVALRAAQRLAIFLRFIASEQAIRGYSPRRLHLSMMREDIANHLGLSSECVSRMLARLSKEGLIHIANREIEILNATRLATMADGRARNAVT